MPAAADGASLEGSGKGSAAAPTLSAAPDRERHLQMRQVVGLDLVRFSAAFLVMMFHLSYWIAAPPPNPPKQISGGVFHFTHPVFSFGWVGVPIFFMLSGFVISYSASQADGYTFLRGRVLRLAPAAWICASITLLVVLATGFVSPSVGAVEWARSVLFFPAGPWIDGVYWTLGIEISFYLLVLILLWTGRFRRMELAASVVGLASLGFWLLWLVDPHGPVAGLAHMRLTALLLVRHGCEFAAGVMVWLMAARGVTRTRLLRLLAFVLGGVIETTFTGAVDQAAGASAAAVAWLLAVAAICASVRWNRQLSAWPAVNRWARRLGLATYPLYLIHQMAGAALMRVLWQAGLPQAACLLLAVAAAIGFALVVAEYGEPVIRRALASLFDRVEQPTRRLLRSAAA